MTKTVFVLYNDEIIDENTKLKRNLKIGEYDTAEEARAECKRILEAKPDNVKVEIRIEQEERATENDLNDLALETRVSLIEKQLVQLSSIISNQITLIDSFVIRIRKIEKRLYGN